MTSFNLDNADFDFNSWNKYCGCNSRPGSLPGGQRAGARGPRLVVGGRRLAAQVIGAVVAGGGGGSRGRHGRRATAAAAARPRASCGRHSAPCHVIRTRHWFTWLTYKWKCFLYFYPFPMTGFVKLNIVRLDKSTELSTDLLCSLKLSW